MDKNKVLNAAGFVFAGYWVVLTAYQFILKDFSAPFWFCNLTLAILAISCFQRSLGFFYIFISTGLPLQTPWIIDWTIYSLTGFSVFDLGNFYAGTTAFYFALTFVRHLLVVPFALALLVFFEPKKPSKKFFIGWAIFAIVVMSLSYALGADYNVNCANHPCATAFIGLANGPWYLVGWTAYIILISFLFFFFVVYPLHKFLYRKYGKR